MEVVDNFLQSDDFDKLEKIIMSSQFPWYHSETIVRREEEKKDMSFCSVHMLYENDRPTNDTSMEIMKPILMKLKDHQEQFNFAYFKKTWFL